MRLALACLLSAVVGACGSRTRVTPYQILRIQSRSGVSFTSHSQAPGRRQALRAPVASGSVTHRAAHSQERIVQHIAGATPAQGRPNERVNAEDRLVQLFEGNHNVEFVPEVSSVRGATLGDASLKFHADWPASATDSQKILVGERKLTHDDNLSATGRGVSPIAAWVDLLNMLLAGVSCTLVLGWTAAATCYLWFVRPWLALTQSNTIKEPSPRGVSLSSDTTALLSPNTEPTPLPAMLRPLAWPLIDSQLLRNGSLENSDETPNERWTNTLDSGTSLRAALEGFLHANKEVPTYSLRVRPSLSTVIDKAPEGSVCGSSLKPSCWNMRGTKKLLSSARTAQKASKEDDVQASGEEDAPGNIDEDWRAFRAKMVMQETGGGSDGAESQADQTKDGWAYETPVIEQGSILLSEPNDNFAINQQYFHKNVIFLVEHTKTFTRGVILNRPTAYSTSDLGDSDTDSWNVWCGGDVQGISTYPAIPMEYFVLHTISTLAAKSTAIIFGVYAIELEEAKALVAAGEADKDDFLLLAGYCGWGPGQLQRELDRGESWTMAAADQRLVLKDLRSAQAALRTRITDATRGEIFTAQDVGDGIETWESLYSSLGTKFQDNLKAFTSTSDNIHADEMLRRWINRWLIPGRYSPEQISPERILKMSVDPTRSDKIYSGVILRGSPTAWILGMPAGIDGRARAALGQHLHKAVCMVLRSGDDQLVVLALLNGPVVGTEKDTPVYWGGPSTPLNYVLKDPEGKESIHLLGCTQFDMDTLKRLIDLGALEIADGVDLPGVLSAPPHERWQHAGGTVETVTEAAAAQLGDVQRRKWYKRFLGIEVTW